MSVPVKFACGTDKVPLDSGRVANVVKGQHWSASDPVVAARPDLFTDDGRFGMLYTVEPDGYDDPIGAAAGDFESATAAPGEKRSTRRGERG